MCYRGNIISFLTLIHVGIGGCSYRAGFGAQDGTLEPAEGAGGPGISCSAGSLDWRCVGPAFWSSFQQDIDLTIAANTAAGYTLTGFSDYGVGNNRWSGGILAPDGLIYGIPHDEPQILQVNPAAQTSTMFGDVSAVPGPSRWKGGVLGFDGRIYGIPHDADGVLRIDPTDKSLTVIGSVPGLDKWYGGALAPNGKLYAVPDSATEVLEFDPVTEQITLLGSFAATDNKWHGAVLAPNGKIYGIPHSSDTVLEIDPDTRTFTEFGSLVGLKKWKGGVLGPDGKIYGIPYDATSYLQIDPDTQTVQTFPHGVGSDQRTVSGALAPNGLIYSPPFRQNLKAVFEWEAPSTLISAITITNPGTAAFGWWQSGVVAPNGKIYCMPFDDSQVLEIDVGATANFDMNVLLSPYLNKF